MFGHDGGASCTSLAQYRALVHILAYASQEEHSAVRVVQDALTGGVVCVMRDAAARGHGLVILPSSKFIATVAPLIAEGFLVPSLATAIEGGVGRYNVVCEGASRDLVTTVVLLFPDCFVDAASRQTTGEDAAESGDEVAVACSAPTTRNEVPPVLRSISDRAETSTSHDAADDRAPMVDVALVHDGRARVAVLLLAALNDSLHDTQFRQIRCKRAAAADQTGGAAANEQTKTPVSTEEATLRVVTTQLLQAKMLLLCCLYATETSYCPVARWQPRHNDVATGLCAPPSRLPETACSRPRHVLAALPGAALFTTPVAQWCLSIPADVDRWYDAMLQHLATAYQSHTGARHATFEALLGHLKQDIHRDAREVGCVPGIVLRRPRDGQPGVELQGWRPLRVMPLLPTLPPQPGELRLLLPHTLHDFLLNTEKSPLLTFLQQCTQRKITDAQVMTQFTEGVLRTPWSGLDGTQQSLVSVFLSQRDNVCKLLTKNTSLLARLVTWCGTTTCDTTDVPGSATDNAAQTVKQFVLYHVPFDASVGQFLRELLVQKSITEDEFSAWLEHYCDEVSDGSDIPDTMSTRKIVVLLVQFALIQCQWQLQPELQRKFSKMRANTK